jgi:FixJ family two-component response regulator
LEAQTVNGYENRNFRPPADLSIHCYEAADSLSSDLKVLIIDHDANIRNDLQDVLRAVGYDATAFSGPDDFMAAVNPGIPRCLILDARLRYHSNLKFQQRLFNSDHYTPVIFLTAQSDVRMSVDMMKRGAIDFLVKPVRDDDILSAVNAAVCGGLERRHKNHELACLRAKHRSLTRRERQVMLLATIGFMNKQIASQLGLSEVTVKLHRRQTMQKMGARSFADLVRMAERLQIGASVCFDSNAVESAPLVAYRNISRGMST